MNNLMEFGSASTLIATAICDFKSGKTSYKKDDVVFKLKDIQIGFNYGETTVESKSKRTEIYYNDGRLDNFTISASPLDLSSQQLFGEMFEQDEEIMRTEEVVAIDGIMILNGSPLLGTIQIKEIDNFEVFENEGTYILRSLEFESNEVYTVYYKEQVLSTSITLDNADLNIPYLRIQIEMIGNNDKRSEYTYLIVEKAAIKLTPAISLGSKNVSNVQLYFKVIDSEIKPKLVVFNGEQK